jgi:hypothetical protein
MLSSPLCVEKICAARSVPPVPAQKRPLPGNAKNDNKSEKDEKKWLFFIHIMITDQSIVKK